MHKIVDHPRDFPAAVREVAAKLQLLAPGAVGVTFLERGSSGGRWRRFFVLGFYVMCVFFVGLKLLRSLFAYCLGCCKSRAEVFCLFVIEMSLFGHVWTCFGIWVAFV